MTTDTSPIRATSPAPTGAAHTRTHWLALIVMLLTSFVLVTAEFLPSGVLTAMAAELGVTPGQAGQTVTVTAFVGFLAAPTIGILIPRMDRRTLLVLVAVLAAVSNLAVAVAPSLWVLLVARLLIGVAISGFWSMSLTVAAQLASPDRLGRAMTIVSAGMTLAVVAGVPVGVFLTEIIDWRGVFFGAAALTAVVAVALRLSLPPIAPAAASSLRILGDTLRRPGVRQGLAGHILIVFGHFMAYTFIRLALDQVPGLDTAFAAGLLVLFGIGGVIGNLVVGALADRFLGLLRYLQPSLIAGAILLSVVGQGSVVVVAIAVAVWGFGFGAWPAVINTWAGRYIPDRLEAAGGLVVAGFQLAITLGAGIGGILVDSVDVRTTYLVAVVVVAVGVVLFGSAGRRRARLS
ncbi:MFS transporter [Leifsonia sp. Root227]|uniref:MFS transporter n=1 Tax=Leifsonia sp. Root227 TaxID=1736496 RepID=UPI0006FB28BC|nr:MFS transporter [Leifsonia sp. Root227]KRC47131.1 MFS transporter [Leifsonia sp. Root227]